MVFLILVMLNDFKTYAVYCECSVAVPGYWYMPPESPDGSVSAGS